MNNKKSNRISSQEKEAETATKRKYADETVQEFLKMYPNLEPNQLPEPTYPEKLENVNLSNAKINQINLIPAILSGIFGTIMGDGSCKTQKNYKNARFQMRHSTKQTEWFMWKCHALFGAFLTPKAISWSPPSGFQQNIPQPWPKDLGKWHIQTSVHETFSEIEDIIYEGGKKVFKRSWLNHMNNYFLMTLWLDDGSLSKNRQGTISLNSTPEDQLVVLKDYFQTVWGIEFRIIIEKGKATDTNLEPRSLTFANFENLEKFIRIIAPIVPVKDMLYKLFIYYEDREHLERWTSELKNLVRTEWHDYIDEEYGKLTLIRDVKKRETND